MRLHCREDVAKPALFLASTGARHVYGVCLVLADALLSHERGRHDVA